MKFKKIALFAFLCLPILIKPLGDDFAENKAPVEHTKELTEEEKRDFERHLQEKAKSHYADKDQLFRDTRIDNYTSRSKDLDKDMKRYLINSSKIDELNDTQFKSLKERLDERIKKEKGVFASKGLREDLKSLLEKTNIKKSDKNQPKKVTIKPKSLEDAQKQLKYIQQNIDYFSREVQKVRQGIVNIDNELKDLKEETEFTNLEDQKNMFIDNERYYSRLLEEQEKYKKDIEDYINSQPLQDQLDFTEEQLKTLKVTNPKFFEKLSEAHPTTIEQMEAIKAKRPDLFEGKTINEVIAEEIDVMKELLFDTTDNQEKLWYSLKIKIYDLQQELFKQQKKAKLEEKQQALTIEINDLRKNILEHPDKYSTDTHANKLANLTNELEAIKRSLMLLNQPV